jgi:hypothetical protein
LSKVNSYYQDAKENMEYDLERIENFLEKCTVFGDYKNISANDLNHKDIQFLCFNFAKEIIDMARTKREELTEEIKSLTKD